MNRCPLKISRPSFSVMSSCSTIKLLTLNLAHLQCMHRRCNPIIASLGSPTIRGRISPDSQIRRGIFHPHRRKSLTLQEPLLKVSQILDHLFKTLIVLHVRFVARVTTRLSTAFTEWIMPTKADIPQVS
jgi:hypothetical protein